MLAIITVEIIIISILNFFLNYNDVDNAYTVSAILILANFTILTIYLSKYKKYIYIIFIISLILKFSILVTDIYFKESVTIIHSGADSEMFEEQATNLLLEKESNYTEISTYSYFICFIYKYLGHLRVIPQLINIGLNILGSIYFLKILKILKINSKIQRTSMLLLLLNPTNIILSSILLRESLIFSMTIISIYFLVRYFKFYSNSNIILSILFSIIASIFHSGMIGLTIGVILSALYYNSQLNKFVVSKKTFLFIPIITVIILLIISKPDIFLKKLSKFDTLETEELTKTRGGSQYLTGIEIETPSQILAYSPLKMIYFTLSPLPTDFRGAGDIISFILDSSFYLFTIYYSFLHYKYTKRKNKNLLIILIFSLITLIFLFSIGTSNAGTAMRHRNKFLSLFIVIYAVSTNSKIRSLYENSSCNQQSRLRGC